MHGISPVSSGVNFIPLMLTEMVALVIIGAVVKQWGHYVSERKRPSSLALPLFIQWPPNYSRRPSFYLSLTFYISGPLHPCRRPDLHRGNGPPDAVTPAHPHGTMGGLSGRHWPWPGTSHAAPLHCHTSNPFVSISATVDLPPPPAYASLRLLSPQIEFPE